MALEIESLKKAAEGAMYVSPVRLGVTADNELCEDTDERCVRLLVGAGGSIPAAEAAKYGLIADASASAVLSEAAAIAEEEAAAAAAAAEAEAPAAAAAAADEDPPSEDPLAGLKKAELLDLAEERGVEVSSGATVAEIREALQAAEDQAEEADQD